MTFDRIKRKILTPPGAQNLVRLIELDDEVKTISKIADFALAIPPFNYVPAVKMCKDRVALNLSLSTALAAVAKAGAPEGRQYNADLVEAFYRYEEVRRYSDGLVVENYNGQYRISREILVPTNPTFTVVENGKQVPVILCGWKDFSLTRSQLRMWMTMLESGLFSFGDYRHSPAEVILFPECDADEQGGKVRLPQVIRRGEIELFNESDMREIAAMYARAQTAAMPIAEAKWLEREKRKSPPVPPPHHPDQSDDDSDQPDLFL